jgi:sodium/proline symporter
LKFQSWRPEFEPAQRWRSSSTLNKLSDAGRFKSRDAKAEILGSLKWKQYMLAKHSFELLAVGIYFILLLLVGILSYRRNQTAADFIIGGRSMNYWLTALAAHASDMSSWLFLAYPSIIFLTGLPGTWNAIGLIVFMFLNWQFIAPKIRIATEQYNTLTLSSFFESRFGDTSGLIRVFSALMSLVFYTIYISAGLMGLGILLNNLFELPYTYGILLGILIVIPYVFMGGFVTLAWIDLFQGLFLMCVILIVPFYILPKVGGLTAIETIAHAKNIPLSFFPDFSATTLWEITFMVCGWGLGYFGQPHIITKFMGISQVHEMRKSQYIGMSWMIISLFAATCVGIVGIGYFNGTLDDPEHLFILMVKNSFSPFIIGFILCAVLAVTINAMSSWVLVLSSNIAEDFYKRIFRPKATSKELLTVSRLGIILVAALSYIIANFQFNTIYALVFYSWSGLGASFGPLLLFSLYSKRVNKYGAWAGILSGGGVAAIWPYFNHFKISIPNMIPGFIASCLCIVIVSELTQQKKSKRVRKRPN